MGKGEGEAQVEETICNGGPLCAPYTASDARCSSHWIPAIDPALRFSSGNKRIHFRSVVCEYVRAFRFGDTAKERMKRKIVIITRRLKAWKNLSTRSPKVYPAHCAKYIVSADKGVSEIISTAVMLA